jgi:GTP pyrophosphokinase
MTVNYDSLVAKVKSYDPSSSANLLEKACKFSMEAHKNQKRQSGKPYFEHPLAVAEILADMKLDSATIITALLHDTVEDTEVTLEQIKQEFSEEISNLVDGVTKLNKIESQSENKRQSENFRKLLVAVSRDIRVLLVKLADRLHNMRTIKYMNSKTRRQEKALETIEIYAPLAERIGMQNLKNELQDICFAELHTDIRKSIANRLDLLRNEGNLLISDISTVLSKLMSDNNINSTIIGREKTPYSIWQKMKRKNINFEQLSDVMAFRVIVNNINDCYLALGIIHQNYHVVPESFHDFISTPKKNGYQSIHTVVIGPKDQKIEMQIRTKKMHHLAELGVAAHWCYKQDYDFKNDQQKYNWVRELLSILESTYDFNEFLENTKLDMYYDQVFCFTPKGEVVALPKGATAVDFAYAVHSDIGNHCVGTKINCRVAPLTSVLENGDQVEIVTNINHKPSPSWENFAITAKALSEIKKYTRADKKQEYINLGKAIISKAFEQQNKEYSEENLKPALIVFGKKHTEELLQAIGEGVISADNLMKQLSPTNKAYNLLKKKFSFLSFSKNRTETKNNRISIKGLISGMAVHFAGCCHPIPGDNIIGIVHSGKGITVHLSDCEMLQNFASTPEQWIELSWDKDKSKKTYSATINSLLIHQPGSLSTITTEIAKLDANISNIKINSRSSDFFDVSLDLDVKGLTHLENIMAALRNQPCIHSVTRHIKP